MSESKKTPKARWAAVPLLTTLIALLACGGWSPARAATQVSLIGPSSAGPIVPDAEGRFAFSGVPLRKNSVDTFTVQAVDDDGTIHRRDISITQVSLDAVVVSRVTAERLTVERVQQLVSDGVIQLDNPENYNVSTFNIVLTIAKEEVPISIPIATPKEEKETGYEVYRLPMGEDGGGRPPNQPPVQIVVFEAPAPSPPGLPPPPPIPGVIIIEGNIRSLKEFFNVRLLLMNTSGIFTLKDVTADIVFPDGGLSNVLPADGVATFGNIPPGNGEQPGQMEREFIIRGDAIGRRNVKVNFGGVVAGPGIPDENAIPFNGSAMTHVEVKGPPTFDVQVTHPDNVVKNVPYELKVEITNTGELPAMYASLQLDVGADARLVQCDLDASGRPQCAEIEGGAVRNFGHILPGSTVSESFTVMPLESGRISSCIAASDQNISLQVLLGTIGCTAGHFPPRRGVPDGIPTVSVVPAPNTMGVHPDTPVTAFFSEKMNLDTITTGAGGTFNVYDRANNRLPGVIRKETVSGKTVAVWQVSDGITNRLSPETQYTVVITQGITDLEGNLLHSEWTSWFTTTGVGMADHDAPILSLSVQPPVNPGYVLPGQLVKVNAYASDQGSGVARVELRMKDLDIPADAYRLVGQKTVFQGDQPPFIFTLDSANLVPGHSYQLLASAYDAMGNIGHASLSLQVAPSADPPTVTLPADPAEPVLQGIGVPLTPVLTGGVREVRYHLDGSALPFSTVTVAPFHVTVGTLSLSPGPHSVRAVAVDGLGQTGEDTFSFVVAENRNGPTVSFPGFTDGFQVVRGNTLVVRGVAEDPTGIHSVLFYLDSTAGSPIASGTAPFQVNTSNLSLGTHAIHLVARNGLGVTNDPSDPASFLVFQVVPPPSGPPPAPPALTSVSPPENGQVFVTGTTVAGGQVKVTNTALGINVTLYADAAGRFSGSITGRTGDALAVVVYDFSRSQEPSGPSSAVVPAAPVLQRITVSPETMQFAAVNAWQDITVTGHYQDGSTANLTSKATFLSSHPAVASVNSSGRVAALSSGSAVITAQLEGKIAQVSVSVNIVTLTGLIAEPDSIEFASIDETRPILIRGLYSDGTSQRLTTGVSFATANPYVATVTSAGLVTAMGEGTTRISVSVAGLPPIHVPIIVDISLDPPPTVAITRPADGSAVERGNQVTVTLTATDSVGGVTALFMEASGETVHTATRQLTAPAQSTTADFIFNVSGQATVGGVITLRAWAKDTSGKTSTVASVVLHVVDRTPPAVEIRSPAQQTPFNAGDTLTITIEATDAVGVSAIRYVAEAPLGTSASKTFSTPTAHATALFDIVIPHGIEDPDVRLYAYAVDASGNEGEAVPVRIVLTGADIKAPETRAIAVSATADPAVKTVYFEVSEGLEDLDHVELYFRRNGIGTFNRYTDASGGNARGYFLPQNGSQGTIDFDSTRMGGDGLYEFYTIGVDTTGNREPVPREDSGGVLADQTASFEAGTVWTQITVPTFIAAGDTAYDGQNIRVIGTTLTVSGFHRFKNLELLHAGGQGAVLTHPETTLLEQTALDIDLWTLTIDSRSSVNTDGRGYLGGNREGNGCTGQTLPGLVGATHRSGGSYGGLGAAINGVPNSVYGDLTDPSNHGSGGSCGDYSQPGGDGGGIVKIRAINIVNENRISAGGLAGNGYGAGSGSGGTINLSTSTLSGTGLISARGGAGEVGGGGGRVSINYIDLSTFNPLSVQAYGGTAGSGDGTVFLKDSSKDTSSLVIDGEGGSGVFTPFIVPSGYRFDNVILQNGARVKADDVIEVGGALRILGGSILTHSVGSEAGLRIRARRLEVDQTSSIDVSARGYRGGFRDGNNRCEGITLGGAPGASHRSGGSFGGYGNVLNGVGSNAIYGVPSDPTQLGSGGSCGDYSVVGGNGGGLVRIEAAEEVKVDGRILASGGAGSGYGAGSGSGGSIRIETSVLKGSGTIAADGGGGEVGGGGGRVAIVYDSLGAPGEDFNGLRNIGAFGGHPGQRWGSAGTVLMKRRSQQYGDLYIDDNVAGGASLAYTPLVAVGFGTIVAISEETALQTATITTDATVRMMPDGLVGMEVNPNLKQGQTYVIVSNTESTFTVSTAGKPALSSVAAVGDSYAGVYRFDNIYFRRGGALVVGDRLVVTDTLKLDEYGTITHMDATMATGFVPRLDLWARNVLIHETSSINVDGRGYLGGMRGGNDCSGQTLGNTNGSTYRSGGSYGGLGWSLGGVPNPIYGDMDYPAALGSGGSCGEYSIAGGDGGGWVLIHAETMLLNGFISAGGENGAGYGAGSGSGGTVNITAASIDGSGTIRANGGGGEVGGGGGRIALDYDYLNISQDRIRALGGQGSRGSGGPGTVIFK